MQTVKAHKLKIAKAVPRKTIATIAYMILHYSNYIDFIIIYVYFIIIIIMCTCTLFLT